MKKSTIIATCLINSGRTSHSIIDVEKSVEQTFKEDFSGMNYQQWNTNLPEADAQRIIKEFGSAYRIDIRQFILDLMERRE
jgi:hypothetical protein